MLFPNARNIPFRAQGTLKTVILEASYNYILSYSFDKKVEKFPFECLEHSFWKLRYLERHFVKRFLLPIFALTSFERLLNFPRKWFQLRHSKIFKKLKNSLSQRSEHSFVSSRSLQNDFVRCFLWRNCELNSYECFASLSLNMIRISTLKNLQKTEKQSFPTLRTFAF